MSDPVNDPHGKKDAWRGLFWSFPFGLLIFAAGIALLWGAHHTESVALAFLGFAALAGGFVQPLVYAVADLFLAYVWRPLWRYAWFQWIATALLLVFIAMMGWAAFFGN